MKLTKEKLKQIIREELEAIQPQHMGLPGDASDDEILDLATAVLLEPESVSPEETEALKKLLRNRAEGLRRRIEGEKERYPGGERQPYSKEGPYAQKRQSMIDTSREL